MEAAVGFPGEMKSVFKVWSIAIACLCYCYYIASKFPRGLSRLLSLFPVFYIFFILPLEVEAFQLRGPTSFSLSWLANFKLVLFSFDQGPLSPPPPELPRFICLACLPIKLKSAPSIKDRNSRSPEAQDLAHFVLFPRWALLTIKTLLLSLVIYSYSWKQLMHPYMVLSLYCAHLYLQLELVLAINASPARVLGFELEAQFNEPYLATSLQDFWGRRWNLMASNILRPTVYKPIKTQFGPLIGQARASLLALVASFGVSGFMHEMMYFHIIRASPTWEVTCFFVLQGFAVATEVAVKTAAVGRWQLHRAVSGPLTIIFVAVTSFWLFFPQLLRNGVEEKVVGEFALLFNFLLGKWNAMMGETQYV